MGMVFIYVELKKKHTFWKKTVIQGENVYIG